MAPTIRPEDNPRYPEGIEYYSTFDASLAQYLLFRSWHCACNVDPDNPHQMYFSFRDCPEVRSAVEAYYQGAMVPAVAYGRHHFTIQRLMRGARKAFNEWQSQVAKAQQSTTEGSVDPFGPGRMAPSPYRGGNHGSSR
jgi:hypothetical protein